MSKIGHGMKTLGHGTKVAATAVWSHVPGTNACNQRKAQFQAAALAPALGTAVTQAVNQTLAATTTGQPPVPISPRKQITTPGHDEAATAGALSKFNDAFLDALRTGQPRGPNDPGMEILTALTQPEFIDAIEKGKRTVQVPNGKGGTTPVTVDLRTPVEAPDTAYGAEIAARRQKLAAALRQNGRVDNPDPADLEIIYFACVGRDVVPDTNVHVWETQPNSKVPNPRDAFFNFLELSAQDPAVSAPGQHIGTVFKELASKCSFDADVDETRRNLYGTEKEPIPMLLHPNIAKDYLTRRVAVARFVGAFADSAMDTLSGAKDRLHTGSRVPGLGLSQEEAEPIVRRLADGVRCDMQRATDREQFNAMLTRLERVRSSVLPQDALDLMGRIKSELEIRKAFLGVVSDAKERGEQKARQMEVITRLLRNLEAVPVTGEVQTELVALAKRVGELYCDESTEAQDRAAKALDKFEQRMRHPLKAIAEELLDLLENSPERQARGELPLFERIIALNIYEGKLPAKSVSLKKAWLRMLRFVRWGTENSWHAVFTWPVGLYWKYVAKPVWDRCKHLKDAVREGKLFGNYGKLAAEYSLPRRDRLAFLKAFDKDKDPDARVEIARFFVAHYGTNADNPTKAELAAKWASAVASLEPCNQATRPFRRWNAYRRLRTEAMEADRDLMEARGEWLSHRRQGLTGVLLGEAAAIATVWGGAIAVDLYRGRANAVELPGVYNPVQGELLTTNWRHQALNPGNWFNYDFSAKGDRAPPQEVMVPDLPQDLANLRPDSEEVKPRRFGAGELEALLGIGRTMNAKERAAAVEWLQRENLEPSPWERNARIPSVLTYLDELRRGRRIISIEQDKRSIGIPVMNVAREAVNPDVYAGTIILNPERTDDFVRELMALADKGGAVTLASLRAKEATWVERGYAQRRMDAMYAQIGVHEHANTDFLAVNPALSAQVADWASLGAAPLHVVAEARPGSRQSNADAIVSYAAARIREAAKAGDLSRACVESGDTAIAVLQGFDVDGHLAAAKQENDARPDAARADFFTSAGAYLSGPKTAADLSILWNAIGAEERTRLLRTVVYAKIGEEAQAEGLLEARPKEHEACKTAAVKATAMKTFGLSAEDAAFVTQKSRPAENGEPAVAGNEDVYALLGKLTAPDRRDYVIRTETLPRFVQELRLHKKQNPAASASDYDPTLETPGSKSAWAIKMGFIVDWGTRKAEQAAKASYEQRELRLQELKKAEAEKEAKIAELKKSRIALDAKMKEKKAALETLNKKSGKWEEKALQESQIGDLKAAIDQIDRDLEALQDKPAAADAEAPAAAKAKYAAAESAKAAFWKANEGVRASVAGMAAGVASAEPVKAAMKKAGIRSLEQDLLEQVYVLATGTGPEKAGQRKSYGAATATDAQSGAVTVTFRKDGLKRFLEARLTDILTQK
jgi:hypothetical protein